MNQRPQLAISRQWFHAMHSSGSVVVTRTRTRSVHSASINPIWCESPTCSQNHTSPEPFTTSWSASHSSLTYFLPRTCSLTGPATMLVCTQVCSQTWSPCWSSHAYTMLVCTQACSLTGPATMLVCTQACSLTGPATMLGRLSSLSQN